MQISFVYIRSVVIGLILLQSVSNCYADTCSKYHKRAPVRVVCGQVSNSLGKRPDGVELTLLTASGTALFTTKADSQGKFAFGQVPKGDYTLRALAPGYTTEERQIHVIDDQGRSCKAPKIEVKLGFRSCDGGIYIRGVDKKSDLLDGSND
jgi:hypothetical protein